jgi:hypothetical protein
MYLIADVVLLATCFQAFRQSIYSDFQCDPLYYLGLPGLAWDAALKLCKFEIKLLDQQVDYLRFQNSLQRGLVQVKQRYAKKQSAYDNSLGTLIHYFDVNGLYGTVLEKCKLPYKLLTKKTYDTPYIGIEGFVKDEMTTAEQKSVKGLNHLMLRDI